MNENLPELEVGSQFPYRLAPSYSLGSTEPFFNSVFDISPPAVNLNPNLNQNDAFDFKIETLQLNLPDNSTINPDFNNFLYDNDNILTSLPPSTTPNETGFITETNQLIRKQPSIGDLKGEPGHFNFKVTFKQNEKALKKAATWTFSPVLERLFVKFDGLCPIHFSFEELFIENAQIRATPVFSKPEHRKFLVERCLNHQRITDPSNLQTTAPFTHLIRCDNKNARYETDANGRQSVCIPIKANKKSTVENFQFMCFSSCAGGLNRRPFHTMFTLEIAGNVYATSPIDTRICACPSRDRKTEETKFNKMKTNKVGSKPSKKKPKKEMVKASSFTKQTVTSIDTSGGGDDEIFTVQVRGKSNYEMIKKIVAGLNALGDVQSSNSLASTVPTSSSTSIKPPQSQAPTHGRVTRATSSLKINKNSHPSSHSNNNHNHNNHQNSNINQPINLKRTAVSNFKKSNNTSPSLALTSDNNNNNNNDNNVQHGIQKPTLSSAPTILVPDAKRAKIEKEDDRDKTPELPPAPADTLRPNMIRTKSGNVQIVRCTLTRRV